MLNLQHRIDLLVQLGEYLRSDAPEWVAAKQRASYQNGWFIPAFIDQAADNIGQAFLSPELLHQVAGRYKVSDQPAKPARVGIVMAGNIPLVGFHDWCCVFLSGHQAQVKPSSKDTILFQHLLQKLTEWAPEIATNTIVSEMLKGCDAYIATGSDNSARYFEYYFQRYPSIIRKNRTSAAILSGAETLADLEKLSDDTHLYFGLGCRNVTKLYVPENFDFVPLLEAMKKYGYFADHSKYKNNYDYQLAILLLNNQYYMTNGSVILAQNSSLFSPISLLHYETYKDRDVLVEELRNNNSVQCIVGQGLTPFGAAQSPGWQDYADGVDTMAFLEDLA